MSRNNRTDSGAYNRPAIIDAPAPYADDGQGGNANANSWVLVCSPMIYFGANPFGRGLSRPFHYMQLYPTAHRWAAMRWRSDTIIDGTMTLVHDNVRYQIIDAVDDRYEHIDIIMPLIVYQSRGTK